MPLSFPTSPAVGGTYQSGSSALYAWDGTKWVVATPPVATLLTSTSASFAPSNVPAFTNLGTIQSVGWGATTTAPTIGAVTTNAYLYRKLGPLTHEVTLRYRETTTAGAGGTGDYLFTLPNSLSFNTALPGQEVYQANVGANVYDFGYFSMPTSRGTTANPFLMSAAYIIPWDATRYRILSFVGSSIRCVGGTYYQVSNVPTYNVNFTFQSLA